MAQSRIGRGKVLFLLDQRKAGPDYLAGHPSLKGRVIFTNAEPGSPECGVCGGKRGARTIRR